MKPSLLMLFLLPLQAHADDAHKASHASPTRARVQVLDREAAATHPPLAHADALPANDAARLATFSLTPDAPPVLLPDIPWLLETALTVTGPHWYTASMQADGYSVWVMGRAAAITMAGLHVPKAAIPLPLTPTITRVHEIVTVSFSAWGATYDIDIECLGGIEHPMCGDDGLALDLANHLLRLEAGR